MPKGGSGGDRGVTVTEESIGTVIPVWVSVFTELAADIVTNGGTKALITELVSVLGGIGTVGSYVTGGLTAGPGGMAMVSEKATGGVVTGEVELRFDLLHW